MNSSSTLLRAYQKSLSRYEETVYIILNFLYVEESADLTAVAGALFSLTPHPLHPNTSSPKYLGACFSV